MLSSTAMKMINFFVADNINIYGKIMNLQSSANIFLLNFNFWNNTATLCIFNFRFLFIVTIII